MLFRRRRQESANWVSLAQVGATMHAAQVAHVVGQRPRLLWLWQTECTGMTDGLTLLKRQHTLRGMPLVGVLDRAQYRLVSTEVPDVPREDWRDAMRWRLKDQVDFPMEDALLEVLSVPQDTQLRQMHPAIALVTQQSDYANLSVQADDAGLKWTAIDTPETALRNLSAMAETDGQAHALLVFGDDHGMLVITYHGELLMTRNIEVAVSAVTGTDEARGAALARAALEVLRTLDTFERMHSQATLSGLSVVPPQGGGRAEVLEVLGDLVYVPIKYFELKDCVDLSALGADGERLAEAPSLTEMCVIGAALRGFSEATGRQSVNLLDPKAQQAKAQPWSANWGVLAAGGVAGFAVLVGGVLTSAATYVSSQSEQVDRSMEWLRQSALATPDQGEVQELAALRKAEMQQRQMRDALQNIMATASPGYSDFLVALGRQAQPDLWITHLVLKDSGKELELVGRMVAPTALPVYLSHLQEEERFRGRRFAQVELKDVGGDDRTGAITVTEFTLRAREQVAVNPLAHITDKSVKQVLEGKTP